MTSRICVIRRGGGTTASTLGFPTSLPEIAASFRMAASIGIEIPACLIELPSTETL